MEPQTPQLSDLMEEILALLGQLTLQEVGQLTVLLRERYGVDLVNKTVVGQVTTAQAHQYAAPMCSNVTLIGGTSQGLEYWEPGDASVYLISAGQHKIQAIKVLRELTTTGLREAKDIIDAAPCTAIANVRQVDAQYCAEKLRDVGCTVQVR